MRRDGGPATGRATVGLLFAVAVVARACFLLVGAAEFSDMPERLRFPAAPLLGPLAGAIAAVGIGAGIAVGMRRRTPGVVLLALFPVVTLAVILLGGVPLSDDARYNPANPLNGLYRTMAILVINTIVHYTNVAARLLHLGLARGILRRTQAWRRR